MMSVSSVLRAVFVAEVGKVSVSTVPSAVLVGNLLGPRCLSIVPSLVLVSGRGRL